MMLQDTYIGHFVQNLTWITVKAVCSYCPPSVIQND